MGEKTVENHHIFRVKAGDILFRPGQECQGFVKVRSGRIKVFLTAENGREIILYRVEPDDVCLQTFGCLVNHQLYSAEGRAESDVEIEIIPRPEFNRLIVSDTQFREQVFAAVAARFKDFEFLIETVALSSVEVRLARILLRLMDDEKIVRATQEMLASEIGSAREVINRQLTTLAAKGLVKIMRGQILVLAPEKIEKISKQSF
jgi:CRP/FNR family transcriptional regulator